MAETKITEIDQRINEVETIEKSFGVFNDLFWQRKRPQMDATKIAEMNKMISEDEAVHEAMYRQYYKD